MKRNYVFVLLVGLLMIFLLVGCQEKMPTECPDYIDLSLDREIALLEEIYPETEYADAHDLIPDGVFEIETATRYGGDKQIVYITPDNVLYLVDYRCREVQGELYKYVTKIAVREGDRYIYKVDNWSNDGLMVAEYRDIYYEYFNEYKEYKGQPTMTPPATYEVALPSYIDLSGKSQIKQIDRVLETNFTDTEDKISLAQRFVPEGATVYSVESNESGCIIVYITVDGVLYRESYSSAGIYGDTVLISAKKASDNYFYTKQINRDNVVTYTYYETTQYMDVSLIEYFDLWRSERGLSRIPNPPQWHHIYKATSMIWHLQEDK